VELDFAGAEVIFVTFVRLGGQRRGAEERDDLGQRVWGECGGTSTIAPLLLTVCGAIATWPSPNTCTSSSSAEMNARDWWRGESTAAWIVTLLVAVKPSATLLQ
jgi:hypothetical protein